MDGYTTEPDGRNVEFTTAPYRSYQVLIDRLMAKRCALRRYLEAEHGCTLIPGGALSLANPDSFHFSDPDNPYYRYIRDAYGNRVVTASTHINLGIDEPDELLRAYRVLRLEAAIFLALTAASPFLAGKPTGQHSSRWLRFPLTPERVPFFPRRRRVRDLDGRTARERHDAEPTPPVARHPAERAGDAQGTGSPRASHLRPDQRSPHPAGGHGALRGPGLAGAGTARPRSPAGPTLSGARRAGRRQRARGRHQQPGRGRRELGRRQEPHVQGLDPRDARRCRRDRGSPRIRFAPPADRGSSRQWQSGDPVAAPGGTGGRRPSRSSRRRSSNWPRWTGSSTRVAPWSPDGSLRSRQPAARRA